MVNLLEDRIDVEQIETYLQQMYGQRDGYVAMAFGHNPRTTKPRFAPGDFRQVFYKWPEDYDKLIEDVDTTANSQRTKAQNTEFFIAPALMASPARLSSSSAKLRWVWADLDAKPTPAELERIQALGAMTVLSGTEGHRHVYLPLAKSVTPRKHGALCRALRAAINQDRKVADNKIASNDLLRLPGTLNWKTTEPRWVWFKSRGSAPRPFEWFAEQLSSMTNVPFSTYLEESKELSADSTPPTDVPIDHPAPSAKSLPRAVRDVFRNTSARTSGERSTALYSLVAAAFEANMERGDIHALARSYPPAQAKWTWWQISNDVDRILQKIGRATPSPPGSNIPEEDTGDDQPELIFHRWSTLRNRVHSSPAPQFLFEGIIVRGDYGVISASDKVGKSFVMIDAAVSCASGSAWMDRFPTINRSPVILCSGEGGERKIVRRIEAVARYKGLSEAQHNSLDLHLLMGVPNITDEDHLNELERKVRSVGPGLVIIDPFYLAAAGINLSQINEVGSALAPIQHIVQRYDSSLIISHHWNKTGTGDAHSRVSGTGLTAWGRFLISISVEADRMDPHTQRTSVTQRWHIKGDEVLTDEFDIQRDVWVDDPKDLSSPMHYSLVTTQADDTDRARPLSHVATMQKLSSYMEDYSGGVGVRKLMRDTGTAQSTAYKVLDQMILHGFVARDEGERSPYVLIRPFTRDLLNSDGTLTPPDNPQTRTLDFSHVDDRPKRRRSHTRS